MVWLNPDELKATALGRMSLPEVECWFQTGFQFSEEFPEGVYQAELSSYEIGVSREGYGDSPYLPDGSNEDSRWEQGVMAKCCYV